MRRTLNRLLVFYLGAILVLAFSVYAGLHVQMQGTQQVADDARTINVSGRQRMLSQRIIYLATDLARFPDATTEGELRAVIADFERSHEALSTASPLGAELQSLYFSASEPSLDARVRSYIDAARRVAADPADTGSLDRLRAIEQAGLLAELDAIVDQYEHEGLVLLDWLNDWEWLVLLAALAIVCFEVSFVFLPGHRFLTRTMERLEDSNTALSIARADLVDRQADLTASLEQSESLRREQAEFTYAVSHDLKSPANSMRLFLSELEIGNRDNLDADGRDLLQTCQATAIRMAEQVEDVLAYSGVTEPRSQPEKVHFADIVDEVRQNLGAKIRTTEAEIVIGDLHALVACRTQMRLLLQNLVENALKYQAPDSKPIVRISTSRTSNGEGLRLSVADNGIGIAPEYQQKIFELFQRLHLRDAYGGSGLGLCTCLRIAQNHSGRINVASVPGEGSTFIAELYPLAPPEQLPEAA